MSFKIFFTSLFLVFTSFIILDKPKIKQTPPEKKITTQDTLLKKIQVDSLFVSGKYKYKLLKTNAHASYYHQKFNGRRTASGQIFSNEKYTAAHKKLPFGTKVRVTNPQNGKSVIVTINDRGPFVKGRDIDLSRRAFFDIAKSAGSGQLLVKIEIIETK